MANPTVVPIRTSPLHQPTVRAAQRIVVHTRKQAARITINGLILGLDCMLVSLSAFSEMRIRWMGVRIHPFLFPLAAIFLFYGINRLSRFPTFIAQTLLLFTLYYFITILIVPTSGIAEMLKIIGTVGLFVVTAVVPKNRRDIFFVGLCLCIAVSIPAIRALLFSDGLGHEGLVPMNLSNKNSFSLYTLPSILLGAIILQETQSQLKYKLILTGCLLVQGISIVASTNRSGWVGLILVLICVLSRRKRMGSSLLILLAFAGSTLAAIELGALSILTRRIEQTRTIDTISDHRANLVAQAFAIAGDNPWMGVSPQELPYHLARRLNINMQLIDAHNLIGHLAGGSGYMGLFIFLVFVWSMWSYAGKARRQGAEVCALLLRSAILLWLVRGLFTREVLYAPVFYCVFGLAIAWCQYEISANKQRAS